ncbi:MAG: RNB domain-containing ribonuclease [Treponema sp.]|nr:RNB domain-containing ribonuclease [Treponema sp.]
MDTVRAQSLVLYKNTVAVVTATTDAGKFAIRFRTAAATETKPAVFATQTVRAKDFLPLHPGPVSSLEDALLFADSAAPLADEPYGAKPEHGSLSAQLKEAWELLSSDQETASSPIAFAELCSLARGSFAANEAWGLYCAIKNTVYFSQSLKAQLEGHLEFVPRTQAEIDTLIKKADEKSHEAEIRAEFLARLSQHRLLPDDIRFMGDVEALALGKTDKSRTLHDAHIKETPERAHRLLLETGVWTMMRNPYPLRWGLSMQSATETLLAPPSEERVEVPGTAYAIDNAWSSDPDDAVAFDGTYLWVHIADPAASVLPDSSIDRAARKRGSTLYIPEGASRMLSETSLPDYALGLNEKSRALSFRLMLNGDGSIEDCAVLKTIVTVCRLTYEEATAQKESPALSPLFEIARRNIERRTKAGAVNIQIPEVHITVDKTTEQVGIEQETHPESADMVREMMLLAGEGAARFAFKNKLPFPFVSQEAPEIPADIPEGLAGQFRLRRCMRKRSVGITPAAHSGLGLGMYAQVTSPLRRYSDLIAHEQLRAFLDGRPLIDKDTMLMRVSEGDAASQAAHKAERKSDMHWTLVYLLQHPEWTGSAVCVDTSGRIPQFFIPSLAMESFINPPETAELNGTITVKAANINLPELTCDFIAI